MKQFLKTLRAICHRPKHRAAKDAVTGSFTYGPHTLTFQQLADQPSGRHHLRAQAA